MNFNFNIQKEEIYALEEKKEASIPFRYNYSLSGLDGAQIAQKSGGRPMYGASMNKPILAFINLILAKEGAKHHRTGKTLKRLTSNELNRLISYSGDEKSRNKSRWSNRINRALSDLTYRERKGWHAEYKDYINTKRDEYGISKRQALEV